MPKALCADDERLKHTSGQDAERPAAAPAPVAMTTIESPPTDDLLARPLVIIAPQVTMQVKQPNGSAMRAGDLLEPHLKLFQAPPRVVELSCLEFHPVLLKKDRILPNYRRKSTTLFDGNSVRFGQ